MPLVNDPLPPIVKVPALMVISPVKVFAPFKDSVPVAAASLSTVKPTPELPETIPLKV